MKTYYIEMPATDQNVRGVNLSRMFLLNNKLEPFFHSSEDVLTQVLKEVKGPVVFVHLTVKRNSVFIQNALTSLVNREVITSFSDKKSDAEIAAGVQEMIQGLAALLIDPAQTADAKATYAEALMNHFRQTAARDEEQRLRDAWVLQTGDTTCIG